MFDPDPAVRSARSSHARLTALSRMTAEERQRTTEAARAARWRKLEDAVDPNRELPEEEREIRARLKLRADMAEAAAKSVIARRARAAALKVDRQRAEIDEAIDTLLAIEASS